MEKGGHPQEEQPQGRDPGLDLLHSCPCTPRGSEWMLHWMAQSGREEWGRREEGELGEKRSKGGRGRLLRMELSSTFLGKSDLMS